MDSGSSGVGKMEGPLYQDQTGSETQRDTARQSLIVVLTPRRPLPYHGKPFIRRRAWRSRVMAERVFVRYTISP